MARLFDDAASEYLNAGQAVVGSVPFTMAAWFNSDDEEIQQSILSITDKDVHNHYHNLYCDDRIRAASRGGGGQAGAITSTSYAADTWHHACGVWASASSRSVFLDGGGKGSDVTNVTPANLDTTTIAFRNRAVIPDQYFSGGIAESALWNVALSDAEVAILALGYSPLLVRPQSLVFYAPLIRDEDRDIVGGLALTPFNTPSVAAHPRIIYPAPRYTFIQAAGAPPAGTFDKLLQFSNLGADLYNGALI